MANCWNKVDRMIIVAKRANPNPFMIIEMRVISKELKY